jgi:chorismate mutase
MEETAKSPKIGTRGTMEIADWRKKIDELDEQIVKLLNERGAAAIAIGELKQKSASPIYEPDRERIVFEHIRNASPGPLSGAQVQDIYERIMDVMRALQRPAETK